MKTFGKLNQDILVRGYKGGSHMDTCWTNV